MKKNNSLPAARALSVSLFLLLALGGCMDTYMRVSVPLPTEDPLPLAEYSRVILGSFTETVEPGEYSPGVHIRNFFTDDVATLIEKPIRHVPDLTPDSASLAGYGPALLITGSLKTRFNQRNVINETRSRFGDLMRTFKDVQNWEMRLEVTMFNAATREKVAEFSATRELKGVENTDRDFNYRKLYNQVTDLFVNRLTTRERQQDRFLLTE